MTTPTGTPAGWYPDPDPAHAGEQRYWDGAAWTEHRAPGVPIAIAQALPTQTSASPSMPVRARPLYKRPWFIILVVVVIVFGGILTAIGLIGSAAVVAINNLPTKLPSISLPSIASAPSTAPSSAPSTAPSVASTPIAAAVTIRGRGDKIIPLSAPLGTTAKIVTLTTNGQANFIVEPLDSTGSTLGSLVNTIGRYTGTVAMNLDGARTLPPSKCRQMAPGLSRSQTPRAPGGGPAPRH